MEFSPWVLFADLGLAALLLLSGQILRARPFARNQVTSNPNPIGDFLVLEDYALLNATLLESCFAKFLVAIPPIAPTRSPLLCVPD